MGSQLGKRPGVSLQASTSKTVELVGGLLTPRIRLRRRQAGAYVLTFDARAGRNTATRRVVFTVVEN